MSAINVEESSVEAAILAINALGTGILLFVSGVVQRMMNNMDELAFKAFAKALGTSATGDPFAVTIATVPILAVPLYFGAYGFHHRFFTAGIAIWLIGASITKLTNLPVYEWLRDPKNSNPEQLRVKRRTLEFGNSWRARLSLLSVIMMACQFSVAVTLIAVALCVALTCPALWLAHKYFSQ